MVRKTGLTPMNPFYKTETLTDMENGLVVAKGARGEGGMAWEIEVNRCKRLHSPWTSSEVLLYGLHI